MDDFAKAVSRSTQSQRGSTNHAMSLPGSSTASPSTLAAQEAQGPPAGRSLRQLFLSILRRPVTGAALGTAVVYTFFAIAAAGNDFVTSNGTASWLNQAAELAIVAVPVGMLIMAGEFDLSIASVVEMSALTVSIGSGYYHLSPVASIAIALALACLVGLLNGIVVVRTRVPSFIVTLATFFAVGGAALTITRRLTTTTSESYTPTGLMHDVFAGNYHQFNVSILWMTGVVLVGWYVLTKTVFGNWLLATGGDKAVALEAGVPTNRVKVTLFVTSALGAALVGIIQAVEYGGASIGQGANFIFDAIVASVIGGVLLQGGYGSAVGIAFGAATYGIVNAGIFYTGWNPDLAAVFIGVLVLAAVLANNFLRNLATRD
jgi:simple sugar transport system permease protein